MNLRELQYLVAVDEWGVELPMGPLKLASGMGTPSMTTVGGLGHALPYLIPDFWTATTIAVIVVFFELWAIAISPATPQLPPSSQGRDPGGFEIAGRIKFRNQGDAADHFALAGELAIALAGLDPFLDKGRSRGWISLFGLQFRAPQHHETNHHHHRPTRPRAASGRLATDSAQAGVAVVKINRHNKLTTSRFVWHGQSLACINRPFFV